MGLVVKNTGGNGSNPVSAGVHIAVCVKIIDLGTQFSEYYGTSQRKVMLCWEVPDDTVTSDGAEKPKLISKDYTRSLNEKSNLRKHLEAWRNKKFDSEELNGFDLINILGKACQIQVLHNDKGYAKVESVMALPKGTKGPNPYHETICFNLDDDSCIDTIDKLPEWMKDKIKASPEWLNRRDAQVVSDEDDFREVDDDGDLPF